MQEELKSKVAMSMLNPRPSQHSLNCYEVHQLRHMQIFTLFYIRTASAAITEHLTQMCS